MSDTTFDSTALGSEAGRLLETLLGRADERGRAQVSTADLLKESGLTQGALVRGRSELTRKTLLRVESGRSANGLRGANVYTVNRALLEGVSSPRLEDESGQNRTEDSVAAPAPALTSLPGGSSEGREARTGFWSRLFRRSSTS